MDVVRWAIVNGKPAVIDDLRILNSGSQKGVLFESFWGCVADVIDEKTPTVQDNRRGGEVFCAPRVVERRGALAPPSIVFSSHRRAHPNPRTR